MTHLFTISNHRGLFVFKCSCGKISGMRSMLAQAVNDYLAHISLAQNAELRIEVKP